MEDFDKWEFLVIYGLLGFGKILIMVVMVKLVKEWLGEGIVCIFCFFGIFLDSFLIRFIVLSVCF